VAPSADQDVAVLSSAERSVSAAAQLTTLVAAADTAVPVGLDPALLFLLLFLLLHLLFHMHLLLLSALLMLLLLHLVLLLLLLHLHRTLLCLLLELYGFHLLLSHSHYLRLLLLSLTQFSGLFIQVRQTSSLTNELLHLWIREPLHTNLFAIWPMKDDNWFKSGGSTSLGTNLGSSSTFHPFTWNRRGRA
jgi:hypothetical protein